MPSHDIVGLGRDFHHHDMDGSHDGASDHHLYSRVDGSTTTTMIHVM